jgi:mannose-6-phosphate isomerase-like protein (cupin superfamily)
MVVEGGTTMTMLIDGVERSYPMSAGELVVVPQGTWHRFDTPDAVKVMTVTPQPTAHTAGRPDAAPG